MMVRRKLPVYLTSRQVADLLTWDTQHARRWMIREEVAVKRGKYWLVPLSRLRAIFPEAYDEYCQQFYAERNG